MNKRRIRLCFAQFFFIGVGIMEDRYRNINSLASSHSDMLSQCPKSRMVGDMIVVNVETLSNIVVDRLLWISHS